VRKTRGVRSRLKGRGPGKGLLVRRTKMEASLKDAPPARFQTAVATVSCGFIEDYVTIMVQNDWAAKCCWYAQHKDPAAGEGKRSKVRKKIKQMTEKCEGPFCSYVTGYRDKLIEEERGSSSHSDSS
jgi:hypothetical protein